MSWEGRGRRPSPSRRMKYGGFNDDSPPRDFDRGDRFGDREWKRRGGPLEFSPPHKKRRGSLYGSDPYERDDFSRDDFRRSSGGRSPSREREDRERRTERRLYDGPLLPIQRYAFEIAGEDLPRPELERKYEEYIVEHRERSAKRFLDQHCEEEWFKERYHPDYVKELLEERTEFCRKQASVFSQLVAAGKIEINLDFYPNRHSEDVTAAPPARAPEVDEDVEMDSDNEASEPEREGDTMGEQAEENKDTEGNDMKDEKEQTDDDDAARANGHSDGPTNNESTTGSRQPARTKGAREKNTVFVKAIPVTVSRKALLAKLDKDEHPLEYLILAQPNQTNFERVAWAHYADEETATKACEDVAGGEIDDYRIIAILKKERGIFRKLAPPATTDEERIRHDAELSLKLAKLMDKEKSIDDSPLDQMLSQRETEKEKLDLTVAYLRRVHLFCYYCGEGFADLDMMRERCGTIHMRVQRLKSDVDTEGMKDWLGSLDKRNQLRLEDPPNLKLPSSTELEEKAAKDFVDGNIKQEGDDKFRCGISYCAKLFCGKEFVTKHLNFKHAEELETAKNKAVDDAILQNLMEDPPRTHAPPPPRPHAPFPPGPFGRGRGFPRPGPPLGFGGPPPGFGRGRAPPRPPPPGMAPDPRQIRQYIDLDAPVEAVPEIDYRASVTYDDI